MPKADVINMADRREFAIAMGSIHFAFDGPLSEAELDRRVRMLVCLLYVIGGYLEDDRGEAVALVGSDMGTGEDWEGGGQEPKYAPPNTGNKKQDQKILLEELLQTYMRLDPNQALDFKLYIPLPDVIITYDTKDGDRYYIDGIHMSKKGFRVLEVLQGSDTLELSKAQLEDGRVRVFHRISPRP